MESNKIKIEIDLEESYEETIIEHIDASIRNQMSSSIKSNVAAQMNPMISGAVKSEVIYKLDDFLTEEIAVTDRYGKATFIGSIEDLLKKEFDDKLLHPVDSSGNRLVGCTSQSTTYIQWLLSSRIDSSIKNAISNATDNLTRRIHNMIKLQLKEYTDEVINQKVSSTFMSLLQSSNKE